MKKKKQPTNPDRLPYYYTTTPGLIIAYPDEIDSLFDHIVDHTKHDITQRGYRPLEIVLAKIEAEANRVISKHAKSKDLVVERLHAEAVLSATKELRKSIKSKGAEVAALRMMRLVFATVAATMGERTLDGYNVDMRRAKGRFKERRLPGIVRYVTTKRRKTPGMSAGKILRSLNQYTRKDPWCEGVYKLFVEDGQIRHIDGTKKNRERQITADAFERYVYEYVK